MSSFAVRVDSNLNDSGEITEDVPSDNDLCAIEVKATAENVDEAVRELPDANLLRYSIWMWNMCCCLFCWFFWMLNTNVGFDFSLRHWSNQTFQSPKAKNPENLVAIILGGGAGTRLFPLTRIRAKPAVSIGGSYILIDIPMSNCINSGIRKVFVLTQFNSCSLNAHLSRTYNFGNGVNFGGGFVEVLAATQIPGESGSKWFQGTADAMRRFTWVFQDAKNKSIEHIMIICGDHLCRMNYMQLVETHSENNGDITVSCISMDESGASDHGLMKIDRRGTITEFVGKPNEVDVNAMRVDTILLGLSAEEADKYPFLSPISVFVFRTEVLLKLLRWSCPSCNDLESEIIPSSLRDHIVQAYRFRNYWKDIDQIPTCLLLL
ncbi:glucose-1-phosphate adenylyltransferase large subunit 2, chloroplastic-like [Vigna radiata var. radiata]|uniref:glucose-1-phosphate adenylyltransferase n=1 Tax=Vigna radiata var. radiata TaxID=3916 RepID=A0A3Q0F791_VIGRR|nr:glucose-1-phosphate adenylyltransferase large subunit 2, chloroplastic-like [Vigna radiata var. radiata]